MKLIQGIDWTHASTVWRHGLVAAALLALAVTGCSSDSGPSTKNDAAAETGATKADVGGADGITVKTDSALDVPLGDAAGRIDGGGNPIDATAVVPDAPSPGGEAGGSPSHDADGDAPVDAPSPFDTTPSDLVKRDQAPAIDATPPTCGAAGDTCCPGNACLDGGCCEQVGGAAGRCIAAGTTCSSAQGGGVCARSVCTADAGTCGGLGDLCCGNGTCTAANVLCAPSATGPDRCVDCGGTYQACCKEGNNRTCTAAGTVCTGPVTNPTCLPCGGDGQPCCGEVGRGTCSAGATCNTSGPGPASCEACGKAGGACCPGNSCEAGGCCVAEGGNRTCTAASAACPNGQGVCRSGACQVQVDAGT